jgi:nitric oxide reductase large subunit
LATLHLIGNVASDWHRCIRLAPLHLVGNVASDWCGADSLWREQLRYKILFCAATTSVAQRRSIDVSPATKHHLLARTIKYMHCLAWFYAATLYLAPNYANMKYGRLVTVAVHVESGNANECQAIAVQGRS